jgi:hypothetical protein
VIINAARLSERDKAVIVKPPFGVIDVGFDTPRLEFTKNPVSTLELQPV